MRRSSSVLSFHFFGFIGFILVSFRLIRFMGRVGVEEECEGMREHVTTYYITRE